MQHETPCELLDHHFPSVLTIHNKEHLATDTPPDFLSIFEIFSSSNNFFLVRSIFWPKLWVLSLLFLFIHTNLFFPPPSTEVFFALQSPRCPSPRLTQYDDVLDEVEVYAVVALAAYYAKNWGACSRAFIRCATKESTRARSSSTI